MVKKFNKIAFDAFFREAIPTSVSEIVPFAASITTRMSTAPSKSAQYWRIVYMVLPAVVGGSLASSFVQAGLASILLAAVLGGLGAMIGALVYGKMKSKGNRGMALGLAAVLGLCVVAVLAFGKPPTDEELVQRDWHPNDISILAFDTPYELNHVTSEVPANAANFYKELDVYMYNDRGRVFYCYDAELLEFGVDVKKAFEGGLNGMLDNIPHEDLELAYIEDHADRVSAYIRYTLPNNDVVDGYGMVYREAEFLQVLWLMPVERGFSRELLEKFQEGIGTNYMGE